MNDAGTLLGSGWMGGSTGLWVSVGFSSALSTTGDWMALRLLRDLTGSPTGGAPVDLLLRFVGLLPVGIILASIT